MRTVTPMSFPIQSYSQRKNFRRINKAWRILADHCKHEHTTLVGGSLPDRYEESYCSDCHSKIFESI